MSHQLSFEIKLTPNVTLEVSETQLLKWCNEPDARTT